MSQFVRLPEALSIDGRLGINSHKVVEIRKGATSTTVMRTTPNSVSDSQLIFNVQLGNSQSLIIDPYMYVELGVTVTITATGMTASLPVYLKDLIAPRQLPIASVTNVCRVQINNQSVSSNPSQFCHSLTQFEDYTSGAISQSIAPIMMDQSPQYSDLAGSMKSPLNWYQSGGEHYSEPRGSFMELVNTSVGTTATWVFTHTFREPPLNSMIEYDPRKGKREGYAYVNQFEVQCNMLNNLSRMFSVDAVNAPGIASFNVTINSASLVQTWLNVPASMILPPVTLRSFNTIICNQTTQTAFTAGESRTINSQNFQISQIPKKIWVHVNEAESQTNTTTGYQKSDFFFSIQSITLLYNNRAGLLSNMTTSDLYESCMACEGSQISFYQSQKRTGAVLCIDPAKLLSLNDLESPGMLGTYNFSIQVTCTNIADHTVTPTLWVSWANDTILSIDKNSVARMEQGFLTPEDVARASKLPGKPSDFSEGDIYGGGFFDFLKDVGKVVGPALSALIPGAAPFVGLAESALNTIPRGNGHTTRRMMAQKSKALRL
jgi:hypothetical protein